MSYCHKELVKKDSDAILSANGWVNTGGGNWKKLTQEEIDAMIAEREQKENEQHYQSLNWFQQIVFNLLKRKKT